MKTILSLINKSYNSNTEIITSQIIKEIRKSYNMTQTDFSNLLEINYHTYRSWEGGYKRPSSPAMALLRIAKNFPKVFIQNRKEILNFIKNDQYI